MQSRAIEYLNKDRLHHIDMLEALKNEEAKLLYADDEGVLIQSKDYGAYLISTDSDALLDKLCGMMDAPLLITAHQTRFLPLLSERFGLNSHNECLQCAYFLSSKLEERIPDGIELKKLSLDDTDFVLAHYENIPIREYIEERINAGMIGAFRGKDPVGFIGIHDDGSMGLLEVLPEYRRRGIAYSLEATMINNLLKQKRIPYAQIFVSNDDSLRLQKKLGMEVSYKSLAWLFNR